MNGAQLDVPGDVEFDTGQASIRDSKASQMVLAAVLKILQDNPAFTKLRIEGHTDSDGSEATNIDLSQRRAGAVVKWLVDHGIDPKRLNPVGCGSRDPIAPNTGPENKQKNRRTEFDIEEVDGQPIEGVTKPCEPNPNRKK